MQSSILRIRVLCTVALTSYAGVGCDEALAPQYQHLGGNAGSNGNPGSSGASPVSSGGSAPTSSAGSGGANGGDGPASTSGNGGGGASEGGRSGAGGTAGALGTGGTLGIGGSGGTGGTGGAVVDACVHAGARTKTDLTPTNGRVECTTNDFGIEGDWKLNSSDPDLMSVTFTGASVCGNGKIHQVVPTATTGTAPDFGRYWGGGLAFVLHNEGAGLPAEPYNATANGLSGISAKITANTGTLPAQMRFKFKMIGVNDSFCKEVDGATSGQTVVLHTGDAVHNCWQPDTTATLDVTMLENYEVQVVSQTSGDVPFDFCLTEITALGS